MGIGIYYYQMNSNSEEQNMQVSNDNTLAENITINNDNSANANETVVSDGTLEVGKDETGYEGEKQEYEVYEDMRWRVLGLSEDENHILLTSENPMQKNGNRKRKSILNITGGGSIFIL